MTQLRRFRLGEPMFLFLFACVLELVVILYLNDGVFSYTLDDAYIHLALAEHIRHGHYGINPGEYAAPASSILWPFLLAPCIDFAWAPYVPLLLNFVASLGTICVIERIVRISLGPSSTAESPQLIWLITIVLILALNLVGLTFTGMEHSLQVFLALVTVLGLLESTISGSLPWWLGIGIIAGPLVRYENLALSVPALLYASWKKQHRFCLLYAVLLVTLLIGFSFFLHGLGLSWLPTSVLVKSRPISGIENHSIKDSIVNFLANLYFGCTTITPALLLCVLSLRWHRRPEDILVALWMIAAIVFHLLFGRFGWFARYETYLWASSLTVLVYLYKNEVSQFYRFLFSAQCLLLTSLFLLIPGRSYLFATLTTPLAANNIYQQQYQMHRFVTEWYHAPVAVNDLGRVSFRNNYYVLDLFGLASQEAFRLRLKETSSDWMNEMAQRHNVKLAMLYPAWFTSLPTNWIPVGELRLGKRRITAAQASVMFYALDQDTVKRVHPLLRDFQRTLPSGVEFVRQHHRRRAKK